jgi:DNA-binding CsgD family transcriptional regulator
VDDVRVVMDAAGSGRAALLGAAEGAPLAMLFAAAYPERTRALALYAGFAHFHASVMSRQRLESFTASVEASWGKGATLPRFAPGKSDDARFATWWAHLERRSATPTDAIALARMWGEIDVRGTAADIEAPTLLIHRTNDVHVDPQASRYLARKIANARLVEIPGRDHPIWTGDVDRVADIVEEFLTGEHAVPAAERVLAALLVTRICDTALLGDRIWCERSQRFHQAWRGLVARYGGRVGVAQGETMIARFDGPTRAMQCAAALRDAASDIGVTSAQGIHAGEIELRGPLTGLTARVATLIADHAEHGDILASHGVVDLASGSGLHFVESGEFYVEELKQDVTLARAVLEQHLEPALHTGAKPTSPVLTLRENEVVGLIAGGMSNAAIAAELRLSEHTVKRHVANILLKLDLPSRAAAAAFAVRHSGPDGP